MIHVLAYVSIFYGLREILIPRFLRREKWMSFILGVVPLTATTLVLWYVLLKFICPFVSIPYTTLPSHLGGFVLEGIQMFVPGLILLVWESYEKQEDDQARLHTLQKEKLTTELDYLKTRINPDFLIYTLDQIKSSIEQNNSSSGDLILRLSSILDYVLYRSRNSSVSLEEEVKAITDFVELKRMGHSLVVKRSPNTNTKYAMVPLTFYSFVDTIFKAANTSTLTSIKIHTSAEKINCSISHHAAEAQLAPALNDLRRLLDLSYPNMYVLSHNVSESSSTTSITLPTLHG